MNAVANIFDMNSDGFIDYYEFVSALHPSRDPYRKTLDADQINEEVRITARRLFEVWFILTLLWHNSWKTLLEGESTGFTVQLPQEVPSGANKCQQIQGESFLWVIITVIIDLVHLLIVSGIFRVG